MSMYHEVPLQKLHCYTIKNLIVFPPQSPTYFSNATGLENVLDLVIADPAGSRLVESCYVEGDLGSDHLPVVVCSNNKVGNTKFGDQRKRAVTFVKMHLF